MIQYTNNICVFFHVIPFLYLPTNEPRLPSYLKNKSPFHLESIAIPSARLQYAEHAAASPATTVPGSLFHRPRPPQGPIRRRGRAPLPRLAPRQARLAGPPPDGGGAQFYFLLPSRFIFHDGDSEEERKGVAVQEASVSAAKGPRKENPPCWYRNPASLDLD
jgi:hypothetical protein